MADLYRDYVAAFAEELARVGVTEYETYTHGRTGHPRFVYVYQGQTRTVILPASPSDSRNGLRNAVAFLRRQLGIGAPVVPKSTRPPKRRSAASAPISLAGTLDARPDPLAVLAAWKPAPPPPSRWTWRRIGPRQWAVEAAPHD